MLPRIKFLEPRFNSANLATIQTIRYVLKAIPNATPVSFSLIAFIESHLYAPFCEPSCSIRFKIAASCL